VIALLKNSALAVVGRAASYLPAFTSRQTSPALGIIMVHGVHQECSATPLCPPSSNVSFPSFQSNIQGAARRFTFISMDEAISMIDGYSPWKPRCLVLTFDDSLSCFSESVGPALARWGIPATFYVSTEVIETQRPYWWLRLEYAAFHIQRQSLDIVVPEVGRFVLRPGGGSEMRRLKAVLRCSSSALCEQVVSEIEARVSVALSNRTVEYPFGRIMSWQDVTSLHTSGFAVGSHTVTHSNLSLLSQAELDFELVESRRSIELHTGTSCHHLCYPYGDYSDEVSFRARFAGYRSAVTTDGPGWNHPSSDLFRFRRFAIPTQAYRLSFVLSHFGKS
jgi:peptidoglycan/xylan/chitin deacetylase (PgdA/CDA1 family)